MATVASIPAAATAATTAATPGTTARPGSAANSSPFQAILSALTGTNAAAGAGRVALADGPVLADPTDPRTTDQNATALAAAGVLLIVPGITPAAPQATPTATDIGGASAASTGLVTTTFADAAFTGLPADISGDATPTAADPTRTRAAELDLRNAAAPNFAVLAQETTPATPVPTAEPTPAAATPTSAAVPTPAAASANPAAPTSARVATPANPLPLGDPAARTPTIPAQAPVVVGANAVPAAPTPPAPTEPVVTATDAVAALPDVAAGDRPSVAGDRFAAMAAGARITPPTAPAVAPSDFPNALAAAAPTAPLPAPASAPTASTRFGPPADVAPLAVTRALAGAVETQVPTAVQSPAGVANPRVRTAAEKEPPARDDASSVAAPPVTVPAAPQTTNAPPAVASSRPVASPAVQIADGVAAHTRTLSATGEVEFRMRLDPPELGRVQVKLVGSGADVRGEVLVADDSVRRMIESQLPELRQRLEAAGVTVQRFDVQTDPNAGGGWGGFRGDDRPAPFAVPTADPPARPFPPRPRPAAASALDVTV